MMKIAIVTGNRPQFIKSAPLFRTLQSNYQGKIEFFSIHSGQHYDFKMSELFFEELKLPQPDYYLDVGGGMHGEMTAKILEKVEKVLIEESPDWVVVFGDTNTTLGAALAASKLNISVAHIEAGLRSFNRTMPEEMNRLLTDHCSDLLFTPTDRSTSQLLREGVEEVKIEQVGDIMLDACLLIEKELSSETGKDAPYLLLTVHRASNTDCRENLQQIVEAVVEISRESKIVFPVHPRTYKVLEKYGLLPLMKNQNIRLIDPVGYPEMLSLIKGAELVLSDSGGVPKEAFFFGRPTVILREETEWRELMELGAAFLTGADRKRIVDHYRKALKIDKKKLQEIKNPYGSGNASKEILRAMLASTPSPIQAVQ